MWFGVGVLKTEDQIGGPRHAKAPHWGPHWPIWVNALSRAAALLELCTSCNELPQVPLGPEFLWHFQESISDHQHVAWRLSTKLEQNERSTCKIWAPTYWALEFKCRRDQSQDTWPSMGKVARSCSCRCIVASQTQNLFGGHLVSLCSGK